MWAKIKGASLNGVIHDQPICQSLFFVERQSTFHWSPEIVPQPPAGTWWRKPGRSHSKLSCPLNEDSRTTKINIWLLWSCCWEAGSSSSTSTNLTDLMTIIHTSVWKGPNMDDIHMTLVHPGWASFLKRVIHLPRCTTAGKTSRMDCRSTSSDDISAPYIMWGWRSLVLCVYCLLQDPQEFSLTINTAGSRNCSQSVVQISAT